MIDAIKNYSSTHGGRNQNKATTPNFGKIPRYSGDCFVAKKAIPKQSDMGSFLFVSGCAGAISMITDVLMNAGELSKSNFTTLKGITRNACIWAVIGGACFAFFKGVEKLVIKD